jgi:hypothetical protein
VFAVLACVGIVGGCGNSRTPVPSLNRPAAARHFHVLRFPGAGLAISAPAGWPVTPQRAPLLTVVASGNAVIALWRYPRREPIGASAASLAAARASLLRAIRARERSARVLDARITHLDRVPAIEIDALERVAGSLRRVLSTHVYAGRSELVLEEYAPPMLFSTIGVPVFARVRGSLTIAGATG